MLHTKRDYHYHVTKYLSNGIIDTTKLSLKCEESKTMERCDTPLHVNISFFFIHVIFKKWVQQHGYANFALASSNN